MIIGFIKFLLKLLAIGLIICAIDMAVTLDGVDLSPKAYGAETVTEADVYEAGMELCNTSDDLADSCIDGTVSDNGDVIQAVGENKSAAVIVAEISAAAAAEAAYAVMYNDVPADSDVKDTVNENVNKDQVLTRSADEETTAAHVHTWKELTDVIHHDAVTKQVWIVDKAAWDETVTTEVPVYGERLVIVATCRGCGEQFTGYNQDEVDRAAHRHIIDVHGNACGYGHEDSYWEHYQTGTETQTETVHHNEEGHYETVTVSKAFDETVVKGYVCTECGTTK